MEKTAVWLSTYREECERAQITPSEAIVKMVQSSTDDEVAISLQGHLDAGSLAGGRGACLFATCMAYPLVSSLTISHISLEDSAAGMLGKLIQEDSALLHIAIRYADLSPAHCKEVLSALAESKTVKTLDLSGNAVSASNPLAAHKLLSSPRQVLENLVLNDCELELHSIVATAAALRSSNLQHLALSNVRVHGAENEAIDYIAGALEVNGCLKSLDLSKHSLTAEKIGVLASALVQRGAAPLRCLKLRCNAFGPDGCVHIADLLRQKDTLEELDVSRCNIGDAGAGHLASGLAAAPSLRALDVSHNGIRSGGLMAIAQSVNFPLRQVALHGNFGTRDGVGTSQGLSKVEPNRVAAGAATAATVSAAY